MGGGVRGRGGGSAEQKTPNGKDSWGGRRVKKKDSERSAEVRTRLLLRGGGMNLALRGLGSGRCLGAIFSPWAGGSGLRASQKHLGLRLPALGQGPGSRGARSASRSEPSCVHTRRVYKRVRLTYANRVLSSALGRFCLKS